MDREKIIEQIKTRVGVWKEGFIYAEFPSVTLENGNKFNVEGLQLLNNDPYNDDVKVALKDEIIGSAECLLQQLSDESLPSLLATLPEVRIIFITAHTPDSENSFTVYTEPVNCTFDDSDFEAWLKKHFPKLKWEHDDVGQFVCYTERTDQTGPYLLANLYDDAC